MKTKRFGIIVFLIICCMLLAACDTVNVPSNTALPTGTQNAQSPVQNGDNGFNLTTANIQNVLMTNAVDSQGKPMETVDSYAVDAPEMVVSAELHNAPNNTKINFVWIYVRDNYQIAEFPLDSGDLSDRFVYCKLQLQEGQQWPEGQYKVEIFIEDREKPDQTITFSVK